nr:PREDICTED: coiled-coil domain-containing protein 39-like [Bemisia tabaci]
MKERLIEIKTMRTLLITHKKALQDDLSELKKSVEHLNIRINQLKKRLEIIQDTMGEYKGSDQVTVTQLKIKIAQTKGELQEEGDDLDAKINKAEQEITAMENTLQVINASNNLYKRSLSAVDSDAPEVKELKEMERQYHAASQARKALEEKLKSLHEEIERIEKSHCELKSSEEELKKVYQQKDRDAQELDRHLENQERKLQRADKVLKKLIREVHLNVERAPVIEFAEQDIKVRELKELNQSALLLLADLSARYIETGPTINRYLAEKSLTLPSVYAAGPSISSRSKPPSSVSSHLPSHGPSNLSIDGSALHLDKAPSSSVPNVMILNPDIIGTSKETAGSQKKVGLQGAESQRQKKSNYTGAKRKDSKS